MGRTGPSGVALPLLCMRSGATIHSSTVLAVNGGATKWTEMMVG